MGYPIFRSAASGYLKSKGDSHGTVIIDITIGNNSIFQFHDKSHANVVCIRFNTIKLSINILCRIGIDHRDNIRGSALLII